MARTNQPDWNALAAEDRKWWAKLSPAERLRIADELRRQYIAQHPDWPTPEDREQDLQDHIRLAALFTQIARRRAARAALAAERPVEDSES